MKKTRADRRAEAEERQAKYDALTVEQKIALAEGRRGDSKRELARLHKKGKEG